MLILLEFDFIVAARKGSQHILADHLSWVPNGESPLGVDDDLLDAPLF